MYVPFWAFRFIVLFCVLFLCTRVLYYCHRVSTQLQLNISYQTIFRNSVIHIKICLMLTPLYSHLNTPICCSCPGAILGSTDTFCKPDHI